MRRIAAALASSALLAAPLAVTVLAAPAVAQDGEIEVTSTCDPTNGEIEITCDPTNNGEIEITAPPAGD